jgi:membrane protease YdiL (CAAX protease family)
VAESAIQLSPAEEIRDEQILSVIPAPRKPHPGFWWSVLWCIGMIVVTNIVALFVFVAVLLIQVAITGDFDFLQEYVKQEAASAASGAEEATTKPKLPRQFALPMAVMVVAQELLSLFLAWLVIRLIVGREWPRLLGWRRPSFLHLLLALLVLPGMMILPDKIVEFAKYVLPSWASWGYQKDVEDMVGLWPWWFGVLAVGLGAGVWEELWCRGFLGRGLVGRFGVFKGMLVTSLFFGAMHMEPVHALATAFMGFCLHFVYWTTRSIWLPMLMHTLNNSASVLLSLAQKAQEAGGESLADATKGDEHVGWLLYIATLLLAIAVGWALYKSRARAVSSRDGQLWQPAYPGVATPPKDSGMVVVTPWPGLFAGSLLLNTLITFGVCFWLALD